MKLRQNYLDKGDEIRTQKNFYHVNYLPEDTKSRVAWERVCADK